METLGRFTGSKDAEEEPRWQSSPEAGGVLVSPWDFFLWLLVHWAQSTELKAVPSSLGQKGAGGGEETGKKQKQKAALEILFCFLIFGVYLILISNERWDF